MMKKTTLTLLALAAITTAANAQLLTAFDVSGFGTTATSPNPVNGTTTTSTVLQRNTVTFASAANSFNSNNWNLTDTLNTGSNYIYFDVTANTGTVFGSLQFAVSGSNTAPINGQWAYTLDGGTTFTLGTTANGGMFANANATRTAQSTWDFTDFTLASGATVEFRFFEYGATNIVGGASAAAGTTRIANISGNGNPQYDLQVSGATPFVGPVNAPEPSTWAFVAAAAGLLGIVVRRRNRTA